MENNYNPLNDAAIDETWKYVPLSLGMRTMGLAAKRPLINMGESFLLSHTKPIFKLFDKTLNSFGKIGKDYFKHTIQDKKDYNPVLDDYVYYPGSQIGKMRYKYMDQLPKLRKNVREADFNLHIDNKRKRTDSTGWDNLKVNSKGENFAYQIRNNAINKNKELYNIKPFELAERDYKYQYFNKLFEKLLENEL